MAKLVGTAVPISHYNVEGLMTTSTATLMCSRMDFLFLHLNRSLACIFRPSGLHVVGALAKGRVVFVVDSETMPLAHYAAFAHFNKGARFFSHSTIELPHT